MPEPLHKQLDTPSEDRDPELPRHEKKARHHLAHLRDYLDTIEARIDEVEALLNGDVPEGVAERERGDVRSTVGAGRLLQAIGNAQRSAGQIYALCAALERLSESSSEQ